MVIALLVACTRDDVPVTTIAGRVQIVGIEATPPQPAETDSLVLDTWVADGVGLGTEVLLWVCTPYEGECLENTSPEILGLPLSLWIRVGTADPRNTTTVSWPFFAGIALRSADLPDDFEAVLPVWALACVPGFCPVMEEAAIEPLPGSEAWMQIAEGLADPSRWVEEAPEGYASLALKLVPLWGVQPVDPDDASDEPSGRNQAPHLSEIVPLPPGTLPPSAFELAITEPDGDQIDSRSFTTAGEIVENFLGDDTETGASGNTIAVEWTVESPADLAPNTQLFVVVQDDRGATDVWSSDKGNVSDPCDAPVRVTFTTPAWPGAPLEATLPPGFGTTASFRVSGTVTGAPSTDIGIGFEMRDAATRQLLAFSTATAPSEWDATTCSAVFDRALVRGTELTTADLCAVGGSLVDVEASVVGSDDEELATGNMPAVLVLDPTVPCFN